MNIKSIHEQIMKTLGKTFGSYAEYNKDNYVPTHEDIIKQLGIKTASAQELGVIPVDSESFKKYKQNILNTAKLVKEKTGIELQPYQLASIFNQESSAGTNKKNYNKDIGEYAWMMGVTDDAKKDLIANGFKPNLNTEQGAFDAAGMYLAQRSKMYEYDPKTDTKTVKKDYLVDNQFTDLYVDRYYANEDQKLKDEVRGYFPDKTKYYEQNFM